MPAQIRDIKSRLKAVGNIQRITKTMQMIATARFNAAQRRTTATKPFTEHIAQLVRDLAESVTAQQDDASDPQSDARQAASGLSHPLLRQSNRAQGKRRVLVLTSNRGLCGGYNSGILRSAIDHLQQHNDAVVEVDMVGKKGLSYFHFRNLTCDRFLDQFGDRPEYEQVEALADQYITLFADEQIDAVDVVYMSFESMARQKPRILPLLPLEPPGASQGEDGQSDGDPRAEHDSGQAAAKAGSSAQVIYDYSPEPETLLAALLPMTVKTQLFQCFNEAVVSEQVARMVAMKAATDAAGRMKKNLTRDYNRARQTAITTELLEVISGAAALE